jgi:hypothetical protein
VLLYVGVTHGIEQSIKVQIKGLALTLGVLIPEIANTIPFFDSGT